MNKAKYYLPIVGIYYIMFGRDQAPKAATIVNLVWCFTIGKLIKEFIL